MAVTDYLQKTSGTCRYSYSKLKDVLYLVSSEHLKDVQIDNGEAYISGLTELPLRINGFNIQLTEETSLDERYKFQKTLTLSMHGYVNYKIFGGRYYAIVEAEDGTYFMVNVDFPARITHTFNLSQNTNQTDFTFASLSNFPTLKLNAEFEAVSPVCLGLNVYGIDKLELIEKEKARLDTVNRTVVSTEDFKKVEFLGNSCTFQEVYDGNKVTDTITFDIAFDNYKPSWQYNLLEFLDNKYSAIITPRGNDNKYYPGFNFGLEPSYTIQTASQAGQSDVITVTLKETSSYGTTAAMDWDEDQSTETRWRWVKRVGETVCFECIGLGRARYLVKQEVDYFGNPTGNYQVMEGYESQYPVFHIVGTFATEEIFETSECSEDESCHIESTLPTTIYFNAITCNTYTLQASCDWEFTDIPNNITVEPMTGAANASYTVSICNTTEPTSTALENSMILKCCKTNRNINFKTQTDSGCIRPQRQYVNCLSQDVQFVFDGECRIEITSIDPRLTYTIGNNTLTVRVPRNNETSAITWTIIASNCDCSSGSTTAYIIQDKTYERWIQQEGFICEDGNSYNIERRYTGTTENEINVRTNETRKGTLIQSGDTRCASGQTKWEWDGESYYCVNGNKLKTVFEWVSYDGINWVKTGNTRLGDMVEESSEWCNSAVTYSWVLSSKYECSGTTSYYLYQKYETRGEQAAIPVYPNEWSVNGDGTMQLVVKQTNDQNCGYVPPVTPIYDWINSGWTCSGTSGYDKYNLQVKRVSYDNGVTYDIVTPIETRLGSLIATNSTDCGYSYLESWRIISGVYECSGTDKYNVEKLYISYDNGVTWEETQTTRLGPVIEYNSTDCGYVPPTGVYKAILVDKDNRTAHFYCNESPHFRASIDVAEKDEYFMFVTTTSITYGDCVTSIGSNQVPDNIGGSFLKEINFSNTITKIEQDAFYNCFRYLTDVNLPNNLDYIGSEAFGNGGAPTSLTSVTMPDTVTFIGSNAFAHQTSLPSIRISSGVTVLNTAVFNGCTGLTSVTLPQTLKKIGHSWHCSGATSGEYTSSTSAEDKSQDNAIDDDSCTFAHCISLPNITIPNSVEGIGTYAFVDCTSLSSVTMSNNLKWLDNGAFSGCTSLQSITLPSTHECVGWYAFQDCTSLRTATINSQVIGPHQFENCTSLETITLPAVMTTTIGKRDGDDFEKELDGGAFQNCSSLKSIIIPSGQTEIVYNTFSGCTSLSSVTIPNTVSAVAGFEYCTSLSSLTLPDSVVEVGGHGFEGCSALTAINLSNVTSVGREAFKGCSSLTSVNLPKAREIIGGAFSGCTSLSSITIGGYVNEITTDSFYNTPNLSTLTIYATTPPILSITGRNILSSSHCTIYVPCSSINSYLNDEEWGQLKNRIRPIDTPCNNFSIKAGLTFNDSYFDVRCIGDNDMIFTRRDYTDYGFSASNLTEVEIGDCCTEMDYNCCSGATNLSSITFSNTIEKVWGLQECTSLSSVTIPNSVSGISEGTFIGDTSLTSVTVPNSVKEIGRNAFSGCTKLRSINIPSNSSYTTIAGGTFMNCSGLTSVTIPDNVTVICMAAFTNCKGLTSVTIPSGVTSLGEKDVYDTLVKGGNVFSGCTNLQSVTVLAETPPTAYANNFSGCTSLNAIYVPCDSVDAYKAASGWSDYANKIQAISGTCTQYNITSKFNITNTTIPVKLADGVSQLSVIEIDGVKQQTVVSTYTFSTIGEHTVRYALKNPTTLSYGLFNGCSFTSCTIDSGITSIGNQVFYNCSGLTSIDIPNSVTSIGSDAFFNCSGLESVTVNSTTPPTLGTNVFYNTNNCPIYVQCDSVDVYKAATNWSTYANRIKATPRSCQVTFIGKFNITDTSNPTRILTETNGFNAIDIDGVEQPNVTMVYTFDTTGDHTVKYYLNGTNIADYAFNYCSGLTSIVMGSDVTSIGNYAFSGCSLTSIDIRSGVTSIGNYAFDLSVVFMRSLTPPVLGTAAFGMPGIIHVPCEAYNDYRNASGWSQYLSKLQPYGDCPQPTGYKAMLQDATGNTVNVDCDFTNSAITQSEVTSAMTPTDIVSVEFGDCATSIGDSAFSGCSSITSITISDNITDIGSYAFRYCSGMTSVTIGSGVTSIGHNAFQYCSGMTSIKIGNSVTSIDSAAFGYCNGLSSIAIPSGVTRIGDRAFHYCSGLTSLIVNADNPPSLGNIAFNNTPIASGTGYIYVPSSSVNAYKTASRWSDYANQILAIP